jgi:hypothetical protein
LAIAEARKKEEEAAAKEKEAKEKAEKEAKEKAEKEAKEKAEKEAKEKQDKDDKEKTEDKDKKDETTSTEIKTPENNETKPEEAPKIDETDLIKALHLDEDNTIILGLRVYTDKESPATISGQLRHEIEMSAALAL